MDHSPQVCCQPPWLLGRVDYFTLTDKNAVHRVGIVDFLTYESGPIVLGITTRYFSFHPVPESATFQGTDDPVGPTGRFEVVPSETKVNLEIIFANYNNRVFFCQSGNQWSARTTNKPEMAILSFWDTGRGQE